MRIEFDIRGNIIPHNLIEMSFEDFEQNFVDPFGTESSRHSIFSQYVQYLEDLKETLAVPFYQWINGSFISRKEKPVDLDVLTFIDFEVYRRKERMIDERFSKWAVGKHYPKVDGYTIWAYPEGHKNFLTFQADRLYWMDWFGNTSFNRAKKRFKKGFIQLNFQE